MRHTLPIVIVAGGLATRMQPLTETIPKCLVDIHGKPLIEYQLDVFKAQGFTDFIFCIAHLAEKVEEYFGDGSKWGVTIQYSRDGEKLLGTAGAVKSAAHLLPNHFMVYYGDTISQQNFNALADFHFAQQSVATVSLRENPKNSGARFADSLIMIHENKITHFIEKPQQELVNQYDDHMIYTNNGIFILEKSVLDTIPANEKYDFSYDVFPNLIEQGKNLYAHISKDFYVEIGKMEKYTKIVQEKAETLQNWQGEYL